MQINPREILNRGILEAKDDCTEVQQVGIDLTLKEGLTLQNGRSANVLLNETVRLPEDVFSTFTHRSSFNRKGILITGSIYDPGYSGVVGCTIYNLSGEELIISADERIGQMVFFKADPASKYNGQWQNEHL